jgi:hypothetical protein
LEAGAEMNIKQKVKKEVGRAYADCWMKDFEKAEKIRNLNFIASQPLSKADAIKVMNDCVEGYNKFTPGLLDHLPDDSNITIAREGSVCMYIDSKELSKFSNGELEKLQAKMGADELEHTHGSTFRIWWD